MRYSIERSLHSIPFIRLPSHPFHLWDTTRGEVDDSGRGKRSSNAAFKAGRSVIERKELSQYILSFKTGNGGSSRNARLVREAPVAHNKTRRPTKSPLWPRRSQHAHTHTRTRTGGNMSRIRMDQTLPCCTTNESPSPAPSPSTLPDTPLLIPTAYRAFRCRFPLAIRLLALERLSGVLEFAIRSDLIDTSRLLSTTPDWRTHLRARDY